MKAERRPKGSKPMKTIRVEIPEQIYRQMETLVRDGWFRSQEDIVNDALRSFVESQRPELLEYFIRKDVEWGLGGKS
jgi:hypothetical protein